LHFSPHNIFQFFLFLLPTLSNFFSIKGISRTIDYPSDCNCSINFTASGSPQNDPLVTLALSKLAAVIPSVPQHPARLGTTFGRVIVPSKLPLPLAKTPQPHGSHSINLFTSGLP
jgi:hypothetical protein